MRKTILAAVMMIGLVSVNAQTVLVRNKPVDLSPVVKWLEHREGERPMPHWKVIELDKVLAKEWGGYRVSASVDGTNYHGTIVIQNIPATLLKVIAMDDATLKAMADLEARIAALERQKAALERQKELTVRELNNAYEITLAQLQANEDATAELRIAYSNHERTLGFTSQARKSKLLAYFTGQKVGQSEVWDCGLGAKVLTHD
ncbi:MAG: hypothetical protein KJ072_10085 [Verrucomicrobia bacterium]|nr:hypothetical protein [Verrucomicrobiota bacterium]